MPLTDISIRNAKPKDKPYRLKDSVGLYAFITPPGGKHWRLKYRFAGKQKVLSFGSYPEVTLSEARERAFEARKQLANNIDPSELKKQQKQQQKVEVENSFESVARCWHENQKHGWTERHASYVLRRMEADIFPSLGCRAIESIKAPELLAVLKIIEARGAIDIAHRALQTCGQIFRYAIATGKAERDVAADLRGALKTRRKENYARLDANELAEFMQKLEGYDGEEQTKLALKFLILTFVRTGEVRGAKWSEIDFDKCEWRLTT